MKTQRGFTLIELMIAVSIVCILVSFSIATYQNYVIRSRIAEGLGLAASAKMAVVETYHSNNSVDNQTATGFDTPAASKSIQGIAIAGDGSGTITVTYTAIAGNGTITLEPILMVGIPVTWDCTGGTLLAKYRPSECR